MDNVLLTEPLMYHEFAHVLRASHVVLTDSGGVQEEAPRLGKPVLVLRDTTERPEAVLAGTVRLVGTGGADIVRETLTCSRTPGPSGDGQRSQSLRRRPGSSPFGVRDRIDVRPRGTTRRFRTRSLTPSGEYLFDHGIAIIGLGYIGLPTCAAIATRGVPVIGVDVNAFTVAEINAGRSPVLEPDLDQAVADAVAGGRLTATVDVPTADVFVIAVPTPFKSDHQPDLSYVRAAAASIAPAAGRRRGHPRIDLAGRHDRADARWHRRAAARPHAAGLTREHARRRRRLLPRAGAARPDPDRDWSTTTASIGGHHPAVRERGRRRSTSASCAGRACSPPTPRTRRDVQADRERLPRRQHRLRQRAVGGLRRARDRRLGGDPAGQPPSAGQHPAPGPGRRRALHRGRPVVHRRRRAGGSPADPHRARGQRRPADQVVDAGARGGAVRAAPSRACFGLAFKATRRPARESGGRGGDRHRAALPDAPCCRSSRTSASSPQRWTTSQI